MAAAPVDADRSAALDRAWKRREDAEAAFEAAQTALRLARDGLTRSEAEVRNASLDWNRALAGAASLPRAAAPEAAGGRADA